MISSDSDMPPMIRSVSEEGNTNRSDIVSSLEGMAYDKQADAERLKAIFDRVVVRGRGESAEQFGRRAGLGKGANVRHYLNGRNELDVESARKFAMHIPCAIDEFSPHFARLAHITGQIAYSKISTSPIHGVHPHTTDEPSAPTYVTNIATSDTKIRIPLLSWGQVELMSEYNESLVANPSVEFADATEEDVGARTKFLVMPDDSMEPRISAGDRLTVEPDWIPQPGEITLFRDSSGAHHVRTYRQVRPGHFQAMPFNERDYTPLDSAVDGLQPIGVVTARREFLAKRRR
jgi:Peptidase S24-like